VVIGRRGEGGGGPGCHGAHRVKPLASAHPALPKRWPELVVVNTDAHVREGGGGWLLAIDGPSSSVIGIGISLLLLVVSPGLTKIEANASAGIGGGVQNCI